MRRLCAVNLHPAVFANGALAMTSAARTGVVIARADAGELLCYRILGESSLAQYFWRCVSEALPEFSGALIGATALANAETQRFRR